MGSSHGAGGCASAALNAQIGVDLIMTIALSDSVYGAFGLTSTTAETFVGNYIRHFRYLQKKFLNYIVA